MVIFARFDLTKHKDQFSVIARDLDADVSELVGRDLSGSWVPYVWLDVTYVKCCW